jgi:hypothetical protein
MAKDSQKQPSRPTKPSDKSDSGRNEGVRGGYQPEKGEQSPPPPPPKKK